MRSLITTNFCKLKTCPSTATLLRYTQTALNAGEQRDVATHLLICDFCGAETHLLARHCPTLVKTCCQPTEMPQHLRRLALIMLAESASHAQKTSGMACDTACVGERQTLTDA